MCQSTHARSSMHARVGLENEAGTHRVHKVEQQHKRHPSQVGCGSGWQQRQPEDAAAWVSLAHVAALYLPHPLCPVHHQAVGDAGRCPLAPPVLHDVDTLSKALRQRSRLRCTSRVTRRIVRRSVPRVMRATGGHAVPCRCRHVLLERFQL